MILYVTVLSSGSTKNLSLAENDIPQISIVKTYSVRLICSEMYLFHQTLLHVNLYAHIVIIYTRSYYRKESATVRSTPSY